MERNSAICGLSPAQSTVVLGIASVEYLKECCGGPDLWWAAVQRDVESTCQQYRINNFCSFVEVKDAY